MSAGVQASVETDVHWRRDTPWRKVQEVVVRVLLVLCAAVTIVTTIGIIAVLGTETVHFFRTSGVTPWQFLTGREVSPVEPPFFGILPLIWGTMVIVVGSAVIALPIGLLSAIYLSEYAPRWVRSILKPALELLAGIPTIVYGYLALLLVTPRLQAWLEPMGFTVDTYNALAGCIVVGIMIIPLVSSLSEDVLSAVPRSLREAAYGLGATKFEVSTRIVLPAGLSGVIASFILAISRAIGETMAVVIAAGTTATFLESPLVSIQTMTAYIVAMMGGDKAYGTPDYLSLFAVGMTLFLMTLGLNILSGWVLRRYREVYE